MSPAPMEQSPKAEGWSREALQKELAGRKEDELKEMARRLVKSTDGMKEMISDLDVEKQSLQQENAQLNQTISLMMTELRKLNIGADNTVEPRLDEGPLDFVGRFWEQVKPRDNTYLVNENVGEIKKPVPGEDTSPSELSRQVQERAQQLQERAQQLQESAQQVGQRFQGVFGPMWSRAEERLTEVREGLVKTVDAQREKAQRPDRRRAGAGGGYAGGATGAQAAASSAPSGATHEAAAAPVAAAPEASEQEQQPAAEAEPAPAPASAPAEEKPEEQPAAVPAAPEEPPAAAAEPEATEAERAPEVEEQISSTVLIEAQIKLEDGTVETLHVRAADRCKEVAHKFIQEHSLKAWFELPLTAWLKKVEADAVKFPVRVEGELLEIRKLHSKK
eukprot:CAMPEP_0115049376 /NCGR_PEP_ID=MMETSP0227-20121206/1152_1 /TAXON_ID=89957 /ORGANISM="Polarella glacialis, Strain CCMP 1383" /LENGTH=390 /DNA_ID=CAMNT_0002433029 /DNA_START=46 /DNA_END=1218 /DNA_ORIENTATION=+